MKVLADVESLRWLKWKEKSEQDIPSHYVNRGFKRLEEIVIVENLGHPENMGLEVSLEIMTRAQLADSATFQNVDIPPVPALLAINVSAPSAIPMLCDWGFDPEVPAGHIHPETVDQIRQASSLQLVQFGQFGSKHVDTDPSNWEDKKLDTSVIRTYGSAPEQLVHVRRLVCDVVVPQFKNKKGSLIDVTDENRERALRSGRWYDRIDNQWRVSTDFQGLPVPPTVLREFYRCLDESPEWKTPSRGLPMPLEGLEILRKWRSAQGQAWHIGRELPDLRTIRDTDRITVVDDRKDEAREALIESQRGRPITFADAFAVDLELQDVDSDDSEEEQRLYDKYRRLWCGDTGDPSDSD